MNITMEFSISEFVLSLSFILNYFNFLDQISPKRVFSVQRRKHFLTIEFSILESLKVSYYIFLDKDCPKSFPFPFSLLNIEPIF